MGPVSRRIAPAASPGSSLTHSGQSSHNSSPSPTTQPRASSRASWVRDAPAVIPPSPVATQRHLGVSTQPAGYRSHVAVNEANDDGAAARARWSSASTRMHAVFATILSAEEKQRLAERAKSLREARRAAAAEGVNPTVTQDGYHVAVARRQSHQAPNGRSPVHTQEHAVAHSSPKANVVATPPGANTTSISVTADASRGISAPLAAPIVRHEPSFELSEDDDSDSEADEGVNTTPAAAAAAAAKPKHRRDSARDPTGVAHHQIELLLTRKTREEDFGLDVTANGSENKHTVLHVGSGSPASHAGIRVHDEIVSVNNRDTSHMTRDELVNDIAQSTLDDGLSVNLVLRRFDAAGGDTQGLRQARASPAQGVIGVPIETEDVDSSEEEATTLPPPVFANAPRLVDDEPPLQIVRKGKFSPQGHAETVQATGSGGGDGTLRIVTMACVIGIVNTILCVFMMLAAGSAAALIETFYFGDATETVASSGNGVGKVLLGLRYAQVRNGTEGSRTMVMYANAGCAELSPILDAHTCASCDDAGVLVGALVAIAIVVNVVRVDVMAPRARLKGNGLCRRGLVVTLCVACIACDFALLLVFRNDCYTRFRTATPPVTTSFGPGFILGCLVTVLDAVILAINCVLPHAYIPV